MGMFPLTEVRFPLPGFPKAGGVPSRPPHRPKRGVPTNRGGVPTNRRGGPQPLQAQPPNPFPVPPTPRAPPFQARTPPPAPMMLSRPRRRVPPAPLGSSATRWRRRRLPPAAPSLLTLFPAPQPFPLVTGARRRASIGSHLPPPPASSLPPRFGRGADWGEGGRAPDNHAPFPPAGARMWKPRPAPRLREEGGGGAS